MDDIFETNAPIRFPAPKEQPEIQLESVEEGVLKTPPVKETVDRWKKEIIDKIQYLRENLELANQDKEALSRDVDRLESELTTSKERVQELEVQLSEALETFNTLLNEVSQALEG
jgi:predicted nuclease with TOPRIM domain